MRRFHGGRVLALNFPGLAAGAAAGQGLEDADGRILDAMMQSAYATEDMGLLPGSSVIWRKRLEDGATLEIGTGEMTCEAWAYRIEEI